jgi:hypothetical protein
MLFDEFDAETSPEYSQLFAEIAGELAKVSMAENDRFLSDFRAAWGGMKDQEGSVLDAGPPQSYVDKWYRLTGPQSNYSGQKQVQQKQAEGVASVTALANIDNAIKGWELDKQSCRETGNKQGLDEANRQLKNLYAAREHEVQRVKEAEKECAELQEAQALHRMIYKQWDTLSFERQKRFVHYSSSGLICKRSVHMWDSWISPLSHPLQEPCRVLCGENMGAIKNGQIMRTKC